MRIKFFTFLVSAVLLFSSTSAQDFSNKGKEFWLAYCYHVGMVNGGGQPAMTLYITADVNTNYKVEVYGNSVLQTGTISAGQVITVLIPTSCFINGEGLFTNKAIRVTADKPVVVYSYITRDAASGATLALPTNVMGKEYYAMSFTQASNEKNSSSYFTIVAVEDNTTVQITPTANTKNGWLANNTYTINLNKGDIYQVLGATNGTNGVDLSGSKIKSIAGGSGGCKKIAVFSGSGKIRIPAACSQNSSDNLYQQLYSTGTWGKKFLTVPSYARPFNYYRVVINDPATNVYVNGSLISAGSFNNNYCEFSNSTPNSIEADKPISVTQYFTTQGCDGNGTPYDPDMIVLNPVEQNIDKVTLVSSNLISSNPQHHIHVIMHNGGTGISSFTIDGVAPSGKWITHPADPAYSYIYLSNVSQGYHRLTSDSGFNAIAYGYADAETYGYSAGANVKDLYQFVSVQNQYATVNFPAACKGSPFFLLMTFPYQPAKIQWLFGGLFKDTTINTPTYDSTWAVNGKQLYRYKMPTPYSISSTGTYPIKVIAENTTTDGCNGEQEIDYDLQVFDAPVADFNFTSSGCLTDSVHFADKTNSNGRSNVFWSWNFGDNTTDATKSPSHLYNLGGNYNVQLSAINDIGCISNTASKTIAMEAPPVSDFEITGLGCVSKDILFKDASTSSSAIAKWFWDLGDGTVFSKSSNAVFSHAYSSAGTYIVTLKTQTDNGCSSQLLSKQILINSLPKPGFVVPDNCIADPFVKFVDTSSISDGTQDQFIYQWNFGDRNASPANPNTSTLQNPQHKFIAVGNYSISLMVTSGSGCSDTVSHIFTINGAAPRSSFSVNGGNEHCSNTTVSITDNSSVDFGRLIKLEIYWDYANDPTNKTTITYPVSGSIYSYTYPVFFAPDAKTYQIKIVVYSGDNCLDASSENITLKAVPQVQFNALNNVCANMPAFQLTGAAVLNGLQGSGVFSGPGVSASGIFNPRQANAGTDSIRYTFTATNGCINYEKRYIKIYPAPTVNAGPDKFILDGGSGVLLGSATGAVSYVWSPTTGLNNPGIAQPTVTPSDDIIYTLTATSSDGCAASDQVFVKVLKTPAIPNTFSPNGDGIHDKWEIQYLESYPGSSIDIYNRYGQLVFHSIGYSNAWDGTFKGQPLPAGSYYYIIDPKNGRKAMSGFVDIIR